MRKNLSFSALRAVLMVLLFTLGIGNAWANSSKTYYATMNVAVASTGGGTVYVNASGTTSQTKSASSTSSSTSISFNIYATPTAGYRFSSWSGSGITFGSSSTANTTGAISSSSTSSPGTSKTATASFVAIEATAAPANVTLSPTDPSATYPESTDARTLTFTTTSSNALTDFTYSPANGASGKYTFANWRRVDATHVAVDYTFSGGGNYGGLTRAHSVNVTLKGKEHATTKTCTITATFPNAKIIGGSDVSLTSSFKATDATQAGKSWTAVFDVENVDYVSGDNNNFDTPAFTGTDAARFSLDPTTPMLYADGKVTVNFIYNGNKEATTHTATLTLKVKDAIGGKDATYGSKSITVTAVNKEEANYDVDVYNASGTKISNNTTMWADGITLAKNNPGSTIVLARNIDLGTITAAYEITKNTTIDLNGKELRAGVNKKEIGILNVNGTGITLTIKDEGLGGGGIMINEYALNNQMRTITVTKGTLTLVSGTIAVNNTTQFRYGVTDHTDGIANVVSMSTRAIHQAAGTTVNINGGKVQSKASRNGYGIYQASSASTQRAGTTVLNISGGEIYSECSNRAYGVAAYGKVNLSGGTITAKLNAETVNANTVYVAYKPDDDSYVVHNYIYALQMNGGASVTAASNYYGELNMTGGEVVAINENVHTTATRSLYIYGIYFNAGSVNVKTGTASDGTYSQKWAAIGDISGGSVRVENAGTLAYGVYVGGEYNSHDDSHTVTKIKNFKIDVTAYQSAYGVYANASVGATSNSASPNMGACYAGDVELTDVTVNATATDGTTAYALMVVSTYGTVFKNATMTKATDAGYTQVYDGEFASAAKMTVNSGTYTAESKKSSTAYAAASSTRSRTIFASTTSTNASRELGGHKEAYAELIIHGGTFRATTSTSEARAVSVGGHTTIDGGHFYANAGSSTARGIYCVSGTLKVSGVDVHSEANSSAFGISLSGGISDNTGFSYSADAELNNLTVEVKTRTGNEADGVLMEVTKKNLPTIPTSGEYMNMYQKGEYAIAPKAIINGGTYTVTSEGTSAYGVSLNSAPLCEDINGDGILAIGEGDLTIKNAEFTVKTKTSNAAYGVWAGGKTSVENTKFTITSATSDAYGLRAYYGKSTIKNSTFDVTATTATAVGLRAEARMSTVNSSNSHHTTNFSGVEGYELVGEIESEENTVTVKANGGNTAYGIQVISAKGSGTKTTAAAGLAFKGDHACAGKAVVNGGKYTATASGTTAYAVIVSAPATQGEATATPTCIINDGKFKGSATSTYADVNENGVAGYCVLNGGFYTVNTNLSKYIPDGLEEFPLPSDRSEYTEGYHYAIEPVGNHGIDVCQIGSTKYKTLEEALQAATSGNTILMIANYTLPAGDWILKSGVKLLIPYSGQTSTKETGLEVVEITSSVPLVTPSQNLKLSFAEGAHLVCNGTIEAGAKQAGQGSSELTGQVQGSYGHIYMAEGSSMTIESGATLYAWGYVTGKGEITVKNGGKAYEMFQFGWYKGGNTTSSINSNKGSYKIFPMSDYSYQNIECPITYYPGASGYGRVAVKPSSYNAMQTPTAMLVGTSDNSMFKMTTAEASANTWVKKVYDPETDITNWIMNSGAAISGISMNVGVQVNSADFYLPITSNFRITLNYGDLNINNDVIFLPGSQLIINKEATGILKSGKLLFFYDAEDWFTGLGHVSVTASGWSKAKTCGYYYYPATYSPTWGTSNPRKNVYARDKASIDKGVTPLPDAELFLHGKLEINGSLYTSGDGNKSSINRNANIHSTNEDAGKIIFNANAPTSSKALYKVCFAVGSSEANNSWSDMIYGGQTTAYPAHLQNGDGTYEQSSGTTSGSSWIYKNDQWVMVTTEGCFSVEQISGVKHYYAYPAGFVEVSSKDADAAHLYHDAATGTRNFVWDQNCYWWEVVTTPTAEGYYKSINADYNGKYNYYYYDSAAACWKIKKITVTWNINGNTTDYSVGYGTKPEWYGGTPAKNSSSSDYYYIWDGWTAPGSETLLANSELPEVTADITYTAHFYEKYYQYNITFKNDDGTVLESKNWNSGSTPSYEGTPEKAATASQTFEFNGTWSPAITTVSKAATYVAQYTAKTRQYDVTFLNYDMSELGTTKVDYNATPTTATYKAAIAPSDFEPYKPDNNAYSFNFDGWRLNGASSNGFVQVKGDQTYVAQFAETTKKYRISFVDEDGETVLHWTQLEYDAMPSYDGPATSGFNKQDAEWDYVFTGWTPATFSQVKGPQTYTATYNKTHRSYTITWVDGNGATLTTTNVEYGTTPAYPGTPAPTKASTSTHSYVFNNSWSPALAPVTGEATYTAQFNETERTYTLTIGVNEAGYGSVSPTPVTGIPYNASVTVNGNQFTVNGTTVTATPNSNTAQYTYAFSSWSNVPGKVTADVSNIQAVFTRTLNKYNVTFNANGHGTAPSAINNVDYNSTISAPAAPSETGWTFGGWYKEEGCTNAWNFSTDKVTGATTLYAKWTAATYSVTLNTNSGTINSGNVTSYTYGVGATLPNDVTRANHIFEGWFDNSGLTGSEVTSISTTATGDKEFWAKWKLNNFDVTFDVQGHGTAPAAQSVAANGKVTEPAAPSETGWTFGGWYKESTCTNAWNFTSDEVTAATILYAKWTRTKYTITWVAKLNQEIVVERTEEVEHDVIPSYGAVPTKESNAQYNYTFHGWSPEPYAADKDQIYEGTFDAIVRSYDITWQNMDNSTLDVTPVNYGERPTHDIPSYSDGSSSTMYVFRAWKRISDGVEYSSELPEVGGAETYVAQYDEITTLDVTSNCSINVNAGVTKTIVRASGHLNVSGGNLLETQDLILEATSTTSGEIIGEGTVNVNDNAYFDLTLNTERRRWYAVAVPWKVNAETGISLKGGRTLVLGRDFDLVYYDGAARASRGPGAHCWKYVEDETDKIMHPGRAYMMLFAKEGWETIRFACVSGEFGSTDGVQEVTPYAESTNNGGKDANWNGIANPAMYHATLSAGGATYGYVLNNGKVDEYRNGTGEATYKPIELSSTTTIVGKALFIQAVNSNPIVADAESGSSSAPRRSNGSNPNSINAVYELTIQAEDYNGEDNMFIQTAEEKEAKYTIGQDLLKAGINKNLTQMWVNRYNSKLAVNTTEEINNSCVYPLGINIPQAGDYTIAIKNAHGEEGTLYLTLNEKPIWNLNYGAYTATFDAGETDSYGLRFVKRAPSVATGFENVTGGNSVQAYKVVMDDKVFIIRNGAVYSADGRLVK